MPNDPKPTVDQAYATISNEVYRATALIEQLEGQGLIQGNGHHIRQKIADYAASLLQERWVGLPSEKLWKRCEATGLGNNLIAVVCTIEEQSLPEGEMVDPSYRKRAVRRLHDMGWHALAEEVERLPPYRGG